VQPLSHQLACDLHARVLHREVLQQARIRQLHQPRVLIEAAGHHLPTVEDLLEASNAVDLRRVVYRGLLIHPRRVL